MSGDLFITHDVFWEVPNLFSNEAKESPVFTLYGIQWRLNSQKPESYGSDITFKVILEVINAPKNYSNLEFKISCRWQRLNGKTLSIDKKWLQISDLLSDTNKKIYKTTKSSLRNKLYDGMSNDLSDCIHQDRLYFICSIRPDDYGQGLLGLKEEHFPTLSLPCADRLARDMEGALHEPEHTDVILKCGDLSIPAHKAILSSRSEVFRAMFHSDMKETQEGVVHIKDIEPTVLDDLVYYIYTGNYKGGNTVESMCNSYKAAHKYNIEALKERCVRFIKQNLETPQTCEILILADVYHESDLKAFVMNFIINRKEFMLSEEWCKFARDYPPLAQEVYTLFVQNAEIQ